MVEMGIWDLLTKVQYGKANESHPVRDWKRGRNAKDRKVNLQLMGLAWD